MLKDKFEKDWHYVTNIEKPHEVFFKNPGKYLVMLHPVTPEYRKDLIYSLLTNTSQVLKAIPNDKEYNTKMNSDKMEQPLIDFLHGLGRTLEWLSNSTSYRDGKLHDFDVLEIKAQLKNLL